MSGQDHARDQTETEQDREQCKDLFDALTLLPINLEQVFEIVARK